MAHVKMIKSQEAAARLIPSYRVSALRSLLTVVKREARAVAYPAAVFALSFWIFWWARGYALTDTTANKSGIVWDTGWYFSIVDGGYFTDGNPDVYHNVVFFPLYPLICVGLKKLFGLTVAASLYIGSALLTGATFIIIAKVIARQCGAPIARSAILLLAFSPFAIFLYNGYSEPAFLFCIALFFYLLVNREFRWGAASPGLASASRPYGCLLAVVLALELLRRHVMLHGFRIVSSSVPLRQAGQFVPLCFTGIAAYTAWLGYRFGEPLAFSHNMRAWGASPGEAIDWHNFLTFAYIPRSLIWASPDLASPYAIGVLLLVAAPFLLMAWWRSLHPSWVIFGGTCSCFSLRFAHRRPGDAPQYRTPPAGRLSGNRRYCVDTRPCKYREGVAQSGLEWRRAGASALRLQSAGVHDSAADRNRRLGWMFVRDTILFYHEKFVS